MVSVAQLVEPRFVVPVVAGSSPVLHPKHKEYNMPAMTLAKSGKRYTHQEWMGLTSEEQLQLLSKYGPGYTDEAWQRNMGSVGKKKIKI